MDQSKTTVQFVSSKNLGTQKYDTVIVPVYMDRKDDEFTGNAALDKYIAAQIQKRDYKATRANPLVLTAPDKAALTGKLGLKDIVVIGMGNQSAPPTPKEMLTIGKSALSALGRDKSAVVLGAGRESVGLADAMLRGSYKYDVQKSGALGDKPSQLRIDFATAAAKCRESAFAPRRITTLASQWAANLATTPSNYLTPGVYAQEIKDNLRKAGVKVEVMSDSDSRLPQDLELFERMGGVNAVGRASKNVHYAERDRKPHVVVMEYDGTNGADVKPTVLIGKGVTFDSGGISLKPGANMGDMKMDMHGSATVVATMKALAEMKAPVKVHAIVGLVENMPGSTATKPGDVITHFNGMTSEIDNTDAEGRLVLFDCMALAQELWGAENIEDMVDVATLTGAIVTSLAKRRAGVFSNDAGLAADLCAAGEKTFNRAWHMPLDEEDYKAVESGIADLKNASVPGPGSSTAAAYLNHAVKRDENKQDMFRWAHLDIAGVAYQPNENGAMVGTGWGVHLLTDWILEKHTAPSAAACPKQGHKHCDFHP